MMIKNRFPKRKTASIDGISDILQNDYTREMRMENKKQQRENQELAEQSLKLKTQNEDLLKKLEIALQREGEEGDRNVNLQAQISVLTDGKNAFEKVLLSQEQIIKTLNLEMKKLQKDYTTLNTTLEESEALNQEMTRKLNKLISQQGKYIEEKDLLQIETKKQTNRLDMEKSKHDLLMQKRNDESKTLKAEIDALKRGMEQMKTNVHVKDNEVKDLRFQLEEKRKTVTSELCRHSMTSETNRKIEQQRQEEEVQRLHQVINRLRTLQRNTEMKQLSSNQSFENLESTLHRKSAECRALMIGKDSLQNKILVLQKENEELRKERKQYDCLLQTTNDEKTLMEKKISENEQLLLQIAALEKNIEHLSDNKIKCSEELNLLNKDMNRLTNQMEIYKQHLKSQDEEIRHLVKDNESWKSSFSETRTKLLNVTYEKSDEARLYLQKQNGNLRVEMTRLRQTFLNRLEEDESQNMSRKDDQERLLDKLKQEKQSLVTENKKLKDTLLLIQLKLQNDNKLASQKESSQKILLAQNGELKSRILTLEETIGEAKISSVQAENRLKFIGNENEDLQQIIWTQSTRISFLERNKMKCQCTRLKNLNRICSTGAYHSICKNKLSTTTIDNIRYEGDGGPKNEQQRGNSSAVDHAVH